MKLIDDTLKSPNGKWSRKSLTSFTAFTAALLYEIALPLVFRHIFGETFNTNEYVFNGLLTLTGATLGLTVWDKIKTSSGDDSNASNKPDFV